MADICVRNTDFGRIGIFRYHRISGYLIFIVPFCMLLNSFLFHSCLCFPVSLNREKSRGSETRESLYPANLLRSHCHLGLCKEFWRTCGYLNHCSADIFYHKKTLARCVLDLCLVTQMSCESPDLMLKFCCRFWVGL